VGAAWTPGAASRVSTGVVRMLKNVVPGPAGQSHGHSCKQADERPAPPAGRCSLRQSTSCHAHGAIAAGGVLPATLPRGPEVMVWAAACCQCVWHCSCLAHLGWWLPQRRRHDLPARHPDQRRGSPRGLLRREWTKPAARGWHRRRGACTGWWWLMPPGARTQGRGAGNNTPALEGSLPNHMPSCPCKHPIT